MINTWVEREFRGIWGESRAALAISWEAERITKRWERLASYKEGGRVASGRKMWQPEQPGSLKSICGGLGYVVQVCANREVDALQVCANREVDELQVCANS